MDRIIRPALALGLLLVLAGTLPSQEPRWRWQPGQVLTYNVDHLSKITNTTATGAAVSQNHLKLVKRWQVVNVDASGVATVQMSLASMWMQTTTPRGDVLSFDSANPMDGTPQLREQMGRYVGVPLAVLRVDSVGRVIEVKDSKFGSPSRFENELPFQIVLPAQTPVQNQGWERTYQITLDPPQGTGEKFNAIQRYTCKSVDAVSLVVNFKTELQNPPAAKADSIPLLQFQPEGEAVFDLATGRLKSATQQTLRELKDHEGPGSSYRFESKYREELVEGK